MNCINHPTAEVAAYCQQCGKPMCSECVRSVGGMIFCEPCLAARLGVPLAGQVPAPPLPATHPNPLLAGLLGFIPGVGAMYNGQFVKALAHILIFAVFVSLSDRSVVFALLLTGWIFYQAFDAYHTAKARLEGTPLPNPFGLNDLGTRLGIASGPPVSHYTSGFTGEPMPPSGAQPGAGPVADRQPGSSANPNSAYAPPAAVGYVPSGYVTPGYVAPAGQGDETKAPVGAIALIVLGVFLLLQTLGIFRGEWIDRGWPLLIVGLGAWLLYRRTHEIPGGGAQ